MLIMCVLLCCMMFEEMYVIFCVCMGKNGVINVSVCECEIASASARWKIARLEDARLLDVVIVLCGDDVYCLIC